MMNYEDLDLVFADNDVPENSEIDEEVFNQICEECDSDEG